MSGEQIKVAVAGQPNCGKSTMFNAITGSSVRVGNYPGISVDRAEGYAKAQDGTKLHFVDLPGTYSLTAYSQDELVAREVILKEKPDAVINLLDATSLERSLYLTVQTMELGANVVIGLNMMDEVKKRHISIDSRKLSENLKVPVIECIARQKVGVRELIEAAKSQAMKPAQEIKALEISYGPDIDPVLEQMQLKIESANFMTGHYPARWLAIKYVEGDSEIIAQGRSTGELGEHLEQMVEELADTLKKNRGTYPEAVIADYRYGYINGLMRQGIIVREDDERFNRSDKIDRIVTHRVFGPVLMFVLLYAMFWVTFNLGAIPQGWVEGGFNWLGSLVEAVMPDSLLRSMIIDGAIAGVGSVMGFTPLIGIMFLMLVFLEDLGYMGRVAYMLDRVLSAFGLHGASVMPFIVSGGIPGGCAVPGVMAARTLRSPRERLATIFTAPFMVCGAKTTAFILITAAFFPGHETGAMFCIVLLAWMFALIVAWVLRHTVIRGEATPFIMELPPYRLPTLYGIFKHTWERVWAYMKKAGTVILAVSIIMWVLMTFPKLPEDQTKIFEAQRAAITAQYDAQANADQQKADNEKKGQALQNIDDNEGKATLAYTYAGRMGKGLEFFSRYAGFPWQANVALLGGFAAKEVFVSTMATAYSMGSRADEDDPSALAGYIAADPAYDRPTVYAMIVFLLLYAPCMVTVGVMVREAGWKWAMFALWGSLGFAYGLSVIVYQSTRLILA
ncbi:ferrous iron transport protein B [uncultured Desulfobacter sp.]|uniref:ferrous iron transport protein B n=1 Tax=uncultured Desulfobacter sp. TaxID=240139 RepID=UPI002AAB7924|nr:ferrous iron transport protein B [uncultured Desulfobacter sp.]